MSGPGQPTEVERKGQVHTEILALQGEVQNMEECIRQIEIRLSCVCRNKEPMGEKAADRTSAEAEVAESILVEVEKLGEARSILNKIMSRLEI